MRTTLQLDDDVLAAARTLARQQRLSLGAVISRLARQGLRSPLQGGPDTGSLSPDSRRRNGLALLPLRSDGAPVDLELVNSLRDELS